MSRGFIEVMIEKRGPEAAAGEYAAAVGAIRTALEQDGTKAPEEVIGAYLNSRYGELAALEVLKGTKLHVQLSWRAARFRKHFAEVWRKFNERI